MPSEPRSLNDFFDWEAVSRDVIDFKRIYADMCGDDSRSADPLAGLMLSQIIWYFLPYRDGSINHSLVFQYGYHWLVKKRDDWYTECRLSEAKAIRILARLSDGQQARKGHKQIKGLNLLIKETHLIEVEPEKNETRTFIRINEPVFLKRFQWALNLREKSSLATGSLERVKDTFQEDVKDTIQESVKDTFPMESVKDTFPLHIEIIDIKEGKEGRGKEDYNVKVDLMRQNLPITLTPKLGQIWNSFLVNQGGRLLHIRSMSGSDSLMLESYEALEKNRLEAFWLSHGYERADLPLSAYLLNISCEYIDLDSLNFKRTEIEKILTHIVTAARVRYNDESLDHNVVLIRFEPRNDPPTSIGDRPELVGMKSDYANGYSEGSRELNPTGARELDY